MGKVNESADDGNRFSFRFHVDDGASRFTKLLARSENRADDRLDSVQLRVISTKLL